MPYPIKDCECEDFPCCEHADNFPSEEPEYCPLCGGYGHTEFNCTDDFYDYEEDEVPEHDPGPQCDDEGGMSEVEWHATDLVGSEDW